MSTPPEDADLGAVSCLSDPVRARLYEFVSHSSEPVGRDEVAAAAGIGRAIAVYHLDKLVDAGLLTASYRRPPGRGGPGAGRPAKYYTRSGREFAVSVPPREYELAAHLLAQAVVADTGGASRAALRDAALRFGAGAGSGYRAAADGAAARDAAGGDVARHDAAGAGGAAARDAGGLARVEDALRAHGFEPWSGEDGTVVLRNCPFHALAARHRDLVCGMNLALIEGLVAGLGAAGLRPALDPRPGQCCVVIRADQPSADRSETGAKTGAR